MWQRIQTLYIAIGLGLIISLFFCKLASQLGPEGVAETISYTSKAMFLAMTIIALVGQFFSLVTFRKRMVQMWLVIFTALVLIGYEVLIGIFFGLTHNEMVFSVTAVFPVVAAILDFLAARNIMLDEAMVQSASRIRSSKRRRR